MISKLWDKLRDPEYRTAFVAAQINIGIPFQIRALLKSRPGWTQATLSERTGMLQPRISGLMTPGRTRPNIETLRRMAEAFDCGLMVRFVPFSELARWSEKFDPESFHVPSFDADTCEERKGPLGEQLEIGSASAGRLFVIPTQGIRPIAQHNDSATPGHQMDQTISADQTWTAPLVNPPATHRSNESYAAA